VINTNNMDALEWLRKHLDEDDNDLVREMVKAFAEKLMAAEVDALCGAGYGEVSPDRVNSRNGYRDRRWDTRAGTVDLAIPKLREGSYFPDWLLEPRRRAEKALVAVVADAYLRGVSTRRVDKLVQTMGIEGSRSRRCRAWPPSLTRWSPSSATARSTRARTHTCGPTP
jgi:putative transposase